MLPRKLPRRTLRSAIALAETTESVVLGVVKRFGLPLFLFSLLFAACSTYTAHVEPGKNLSKYKEFFVKDSLSDNHGMANRIAFALRERGFKAESGPMTLIPNSAQVVILFDDQWTGDFSPHISGLSLRVVDAHTQEPLAVGVYSAPAAITTSLDNVIDDLVGKLVKTPVTRADAPASNPILPPKS